ncbi:MAG: UvrD-helicase domain-containing protein [Bacteroidales bacterium]|nr:UvrD-helicase domain-containing protein [Bacteroidales bacterium]
MSFTVYKASAGSGKTFSLAKEYIKITLQNPDDFRHILAITFTNKAANEMKSRIIEYLADFASDDPNAPGKKSLLPEILKETNLSESEVISRSSVILKNILYKYADFSVMTIDSFFQKIIRSFSHDLHIPINFKLEMNLDEIVAQVVDNLIDKVGEDKAIYEILIQYINKLTEDKKSWHIEKNLGDFSKEIFSETAYQHLKTLDGYDVDDFIEIIKNLRNDSNVISKEIVEISAKTIQIIQQQNIGLEDFYGKTRGIGAWLLKIQDGHKEVSNAVLKAIKDDVWFSKTGYLPHFDIIKEEVTLKITKIVQDIRDYNDIKRISKDIYALALVNQIKNVIFQIKDQENLFFISETNFVLADVLLNQPTPFIYERIGERYFHYFIDEFQDTSKLQWNNMIPLILEAISGLHNQKPGSAIIFGDPKQSIYRFRGGDFMQFINLPKVKTENDELMDIAANNLISADFRTQNLDTNHRSKMQIIDFNNKLFDSIKCYIPEYSKLYEDHEQKFKNEKEDGIVDISIINKEKKSDAEYLAMVYERILEIINKAKEENYQLKDIAILGREKKILRNIASVLNHHNIPIISSDSLQLDSSPVVRFLKNMIHLHKSTNDQIINAGIINYLSDQNPSINFEESLSYSKDYHSLLDFFKKYNFDVKSDIWAQLNIYDLCEEMIRTFIDSEHVDAYLMGFIDVVYKYHIDGESEAAFSEWWNENKEKHSIAVPEGIDGIKILTIHAAKGLQFPIVITPFSSFRRKLSEIWISAEEMSEEIPSYKLPSARIKDSSASEDSRFFKKISEEHTLSTVDEINAAYVALTRAVNRLYIILPTPSESALKKEDYQFEKVMSSFVKNNNFTETIFDNYTNYSVGYEEVRDAENNLEIENNNNFSNFISKKWYDSVVQIPKKIESEAIEWGSLFHYTMQHIVHLKDMENAIERTRLHYILDDDVCKKLSELVVQTCENPMLKDYFKEGIKVYNEKSIMDSSGEIFRPDRLIIDKNRAVIIDFKTGIPKEIHQEQVLNYKNLLLETGIEEIRSFVVYVNDDKTEAVEY